MSWLPPWAQLSLRRQLVHKTTSGCRRTRCLVDSLSCSLGEVLKSRRLVSTSVRHHSSIPLKYSPLGGIRGDTVVRWGWQCRILGLCSAIASQTTSPQDYETTSGYRPALQTTRPQDYETTSGYHPTSCLVDSLSCCRGDVVRPRAQPPLSISHQYPPKGDTWYTGVRLG